MKQKALVTTAIIVAGIVTVVALTYGQVWVAASVCRMAFSQCVREIGVKGVATIVGISLGVSATGVLAGLSAIF